MPVAFDIADFEREASARTGLEDFGSSDWREALGVYLDSVASEADLNDAGHAIVAGEVVAHLVNRLEIQDWVTRHPEVRDEATRAPLILATLPRTGQTAAGWLLDRDPANRSLLTWQVKRPCPPPTADRRADDARLAREHEAVAAMPEELRAMHLTDAEEPDECHWLLSNAFKTPHHVYAMRVPTHYAWARDRAEMRSAYEYHRLQLQLLQSRRPPARWVLKNSPHLLYLDELLAVYPDAQLVQFHRDPLRVLASNCKLALFLRHMRSDRVDPHEVGSTILQLLRDYVERLLRFRASSASPRWIDVRFADFVADPLREMERVYAAAEIEMTSVVRRGMATWVRENPRDERSRSAPDLAPFGIDLEHARACFKEYCETFSVPLDGV